MAKHSGAQWLRMLLLPFVLATVAVAQSNYDQVENSIEFPSPDKGLPESTVLDGKVTKLDELSPVIFLNRTKAALNCAAGYMQIELKFEEPFYGRAYADFDRSSACSVTGKGNNTARIDLPLKGCGTRQDPQRVFTNNIVVRFHPYLEMDGDEVVTIVCRYPPPIAPPPAGIPNKISVLPSTPLEPPLKGFQILLIICGILFLSLVLLGLGCSYYCLRNQQVQVVRRHPLSSVGSDKLSDSSLSMFDGLKIPRARAPTLDSSSGSEMALVSAGDTLPSDYPSESPSSEAEELDGRSLRRSPSSGGSYENRAFQQEYYAERYQHELPPPPLPPAVQPKFDVQLRVKRAPPPTPSPTPPPSESEVSIAALERNLTTILEKDETTMSVVEEQQHGYDYGHTASPSPQPIKARTPPVYSTVLRKDRDESEWYRTEESMALERRESPPLRRTPPMMPPPLEHHQYQSSKYTSEMQVDVIEPPVVVTKRPEITSHTVDDVFLKTITEKKTIEDVERHRREVVEYKPKPMPPPTSWDVTIKNYPNPDAQYPQSGEDTATDWDSYSEASSVAGYPATAMDRQSRIQSYNTSLSSSVGREEHHLRYLSTAEIPIPKPENWESLVRVLEPEPEPSSSGGPPARYRVEQTLTLEDKRKWRQIITTESTLRQLITEATVREDFERIRSDPRYERIFEPEKWDVIIRVIAPPPQQQQHYDQKTAGSSNRYAKNKKIEFEGARTRRNSLPTVYEYDSDDGSSVRTLTTADDHGPLGPARSRKTSRSSFKSDMDVRSMSEMTVDFRRPDLPDNYSDVSSVYNYHHHQQQHSRRGSSYYADDDAGSLVRSLSQPSLARSASEFTENNWGLRIRSYEDGDDLTSPDHTPRSSFRSRRSTRDRDHQQQQYSEFSSSGATTTSRRMFGGRTVSAAEWFHDSDENDVSYKL
uniref:ZP domain-containing protein n=1 Tax=Sipha flava TaxID=143950 RepID=A0A2S2PUX2_9HEMI